MRYPRQIAFTALMALALAFNANQALSAGAGAFIETVAERTFTSFGETGISDEERTKRFRKILTEVFDLPAIARFTLGRYWRSASEEQRIEYVRLFEDFVVLAYANRFGDLAGTRLHIGGVREIGSTEALVTSEVILSGRPPVRMDWRVRCDGSGHKITDILVEGISMIVTQRDEFASVIRRGGGRVDSLLSALRQKIAKN